MALRNASKNKDFFFLGGSTDQHCNTLYGEMISDNIKKARNSNLPQWSTLASQWVESIDAKVIFMPSRKSSDRGKQDIAPRVRFSCRDTRSRQLLEQLNEVVVDGPWQMGCTLSEDLVIGRLGSTIPNGLRRQIAVCILKQSVDEEIVKSGMTECLNVSSAAGTQQFQAWMTSVTPDVSDIAALQDAEFMSWANRNNHKLVASAHDTSVLQLPDSSSIGEQKVYRACAHVATGRPNLRLRVGQIGL